MSTVWNKNRPTKPIVDPLYKQIVKFLLQDNRSTYAKANVSGLSQSTLNNWIKGKVRRPQSVSLQMAADMLGKKLTLVDK